MAGEGGRAATQVNSHIQDRSVSRAHELSLRLADLVVQAAYDRMGAGKAFLTHLYDFMHSPASLALDVK